MCTAFMPVNCLASNGYLEGGPETKVKGLFPVCRKMPVGLGSGLLERERPNPEGGRARAVDSQGGVLWIILPTCLGALQIFSMCPRHREVGKHWLDYNGLSVSSSPFADKQPEFLPFLPLSQHRCSTQHPPWPRGPTWPSCHRLLVFSGPGTGWSTGQMPSTNGSAH